MKSEDIKIGMRIFNNGDMANFEHYGAISKIIKNDRFGDQVEITPDLESERKPYTISPIMINEIDKGNGSTRIVTEKAHKIYRRNQLNILRRSMKRRLDQ